MCVCVCVNSSDRIISHMNDEVRSPECVSGLIRVCLLTSTEVNSNEADRFWFSSLSGIPHVHRRVFCIHAFLKPGKKKKKPQFTL